MTPSAHYGKPKLPVKQLAILGKPLRSSLTFSAGGHICPIKSAQGLSTSSSMSQNALLQPLAGHGWNPHALDPFLSSMGQVNSWVKSLTSVPRWAYLRQRPSDRHWLRFSGARNIIMSRGINPHFVTYANDIASSYCQIRRATGPNFGLPISSPDDQEFRSSRDKCCQMGRFCGLHFLSVAEYVCYFLGPPLRQDRPEAHDFNGSDQCHVLFYTLGYFKNSCPSFCCSVLDGTWKWKW